MSKKLGEGKTLCETQMSSPTCATTKAEVWGKWRKPANLAQSAKIGLLSNGYQFYTAIVNGSVII